MNEFVVSLLISIVAVGVAFWQVSISRAQLREAKTTKSDTEKLLAEIRTSVNRIEISSEETRKRVNDQVDKLIDKQDENMKRLLDSPKEKSQSDLLMALIPEIFKSPDLLKTIIDAGNKGK